MVYFRKGVLSSQFIEGLVLVLAAVLIVLLNVSNFVVNLGCGLSVCQSSKSKLNHTTYYRLYDLIMKVWERIQHHDQSTAEERNLVRVITSILASVLSEY